MNARNKKARSQRAAKLTRNTIIYIILVMISIIWLIPFFYLVLQSFSEQFVAQDFIPKHWTLENYKLLFTDKTFPFLRWWINTFVIAIITCILKTCLVLMSSYALSRLRFKSRKLIMNLILILGMFPGFIGMIAVVFILKLIGLNGPQTGIFGLVLVYCAGSIMEYYIAKGFFDTISKSLDEAAMIDGASKNTIFWKIIMPLSKPIVVYTILMAFNGPWGDFMIASILTANVSESFNVAVGLQQLAQTKGSATQFSRFCAGGVLVSIPITILFFCLQKYYVSGITGGAVKG